MLIINISQHQSIDIVYIQQQNTIQIYNSKSVHVGPIDILTCSTDAQ